MSRQSLVSSFENVLQQLKTANLENIVTLPPNFQPWNGLDLTDLKEGYEEVISVLDKAVSSGLIKDLPFNFIQSLIQQVTQVVSQGQQVIQSVQPNRQGFLNSLISTVESLRSNIRSFGLHTIVKLGPDLPKITEAINLQIAQLTDANKKVDALRMNVEALINPAMAGSLSSSFGVRQKSLNKVKYVWLVIVLVVGIWAILKTAEFSDKILVLFGDGHLQGTKPEFSALAFVRYTILVPIYILFGFCVSQYKKERGLEEDYAHKAAVSSTLPSYGNLLVDAKVKDQVLAGAANVIFSTPGLETEVLPTKGKEQLFNLGDLKEVLQVLKGDSKV